MCRRFVAVPLSFGLVVEWFADRAIGDQLIALRQPKARDLRFLVMTMKIASDLVDEGQIDEREALLRQEPEKLDELLHQTFDRTSSVDVIAKGVGASPGAAVGKAVAAHHHGVPQAGGAFGRYFVAHCLVQATEHYVGQHLPGDVTRRDRRRRR